MLFWTPPLLSLPLKMPPFFFFLCRKVLWQPTYSPFTNSFLEISLPHTIRTNSDLPWCVCKGDCEFQMGEMGQKWWTAELWAPRAAEHVRPAQRVQRCFGFYSPVSLEEKCSQNQLCHWEGTERNSLGGPAGEERVWLQSKKCIFFFTYNSLRNTDNWQGNSCISP